MVVARLAVVSDISGEIGGYQFLHVSATSSYDLDPLCIEDVQCSLSHIAGKHHRHSHLTENRSDPALASASFRRSHLAYIDHFTFNDIKY